MLNDKKYIGMDVHKESISIAVSNGAGKIVMECVIETKASMILQFINGLRGDLQVTFEEGTSATEKCFFLTSTFIELGSTIRASQYWLILERGYNSFLAQ